MPGVVPTRTVLRSCVRELACSRTWHNAFGCSGALEHSGATVSRIGRLQECAFERLTPTLLSSNTALELDN
eukprot:1156580-Alexandrium_andersonii.AAC.1